jgi:hypothetical protein
MMLNKKREAKAKMEIMGRTDKSSQAREEVLEVIWHVSIIIL